MSPSKGRTLKYKQVLDALNPTTLYTPGMIAKMAAERNLLPMDPKGSLEVRLTIQRVRIAMSRLCYNRQFPKHGDGIVTIHGQAPMPAWYGWRWQAAGSNASQRTGTP